MRASAMLLSILSFVPAFAFGQSLPADSIDTKDGKLLIVQVQESDRFPPDCATPRTRGCDQVQPGFKIVVIWLKTVDTAKAGAVGSALMRSFDEIQVVADDGTKTKAYSGGMRSGKLFIAFTPPAAARIQSLAWPDNPPIPLAKP